MKIKFEQLLSIVDATSYRDGGAWTENKFGHYLDKDFPNSELYWKKFIVPSTNRLYGNQYPNKLYTDNRDGISDDLLDIGSFHYTIFYHLYRAEKRLDFEDFYVKLGTICDLVEEFLMLVYFINLTCRGEQSKVLEKLSKEEFLKIASEWYDENYLELYNVYFKNSRYTPIKILKGKDILKEYYSGDKSLKRYRTFSLGIKAYRNKIAHYYILGRLQDSNGNFYIPKKNKIYLYKRWKDLEKVRNDNTKFHEDFIEEKTQMANDLTEMKQVLNSLWEKPIRDMDELLYTQRNPLLLEKYDLTF